MKPTAILCLAVALAPRAAPAAERVLTLEAARARARQQAPAVLAAQARTEAARGRLQGAAVLFPTNPEMGVAFGQRRTPAGDTRELDARIAQRFELGGRRGARVDGARADLECLQATSADELRLVLRDVSVAFHRAVQAQQAMALAVAAESLSARTLHVAEERHRAGDVAILDVNLARADLGHARADVHAAIALQVEAHERLRVLLDIPADESFTVAGDLALARSYDLAALEARVQERPDLVALAAALRVAEHEQRLGRALRWPELQLGAGYEQEEGEDIVLGEVGLTLPVFERGQGLRAEAAARVRELSSQLESARRAAIAELAAAFAVHAERARAAEVLAHESLPLLDQNEKLASRSYATGQIGLAELLLVRNATLGMRAEHLDKQLEAAIAAVDLEATAGVLE